jgi:hypothetical protein
MEMREDEDGRGTDGVRVGDDGSAARRGIGMSQDPESGVCLLC